MKSKEDYRLLVVDDEAAIREPIAVYLKHQGYKVDTAENGIEALHLLHTNIYDIIILDIKLPYIDGKQLCQALQDERIQIPVLVITAVETNEILYQEAGRLHKIFSLRTLEEKVRSIIEDRGA